MTALFADLVGSTSIEEALDPEDARDIVGGALGRMIAAVEEFGGTVKDLAGDGVLALFGAPLAHEDDPERAVLCGLRIVEVIDGYAREVERAWRLSDLSVRVGIETGRVVVGPVGAGSRVEYGAVGDAVNTAARLQAEAGAGGVLVGEATRRGIDHRFVWGVRRELSLRGKRTPVVASVVIRQVGAREVGVVPLAGGSAPLVGRDREHRIIGEALGDLTRGRGSLVVVVGEPGVGKSRLVVHVRDEVAHSEAAKWMETGCASYAVSMPYRPYQLLLWKWLGLSPVPSAPEVNGAIGARAARLPDLSTAALRGLEALLDPSPSVGLPSDPEKIRQRVFLGVRELFGRLSRRQPLVVALEDLHWCDPSSLILTEHLVELVETNALMLLLTLRPDTEALTFTERVVGRFAGRSRRLELAPLSPDDDRVLLHALIGASVLPRQLEKRLLGVTEGNPFFLEEQLRAMVASGALVRGGAGWRFVGPAPDELAATVERALLARIDRLGSASRSMLLAASVIGPSFDRSLLASLVDDEAGFEEGLAALVEGGFVRCVSSDADELGFCHALVQEAAYSSLLRRRRRALHARAATALQEKFQGRTGEVAAQLGHHLAEGGDTRAAIPYLIDAARAAAARFANEEAVALYRRALTLFERDQDDARESGMQQALYRELGKALMMLAHYDDAVDAFRSSQTLVPASDVVERARLDVLLGDTHRREHHYQDALYHYDEAERLTRSPPTRGADTFAVWLDCQLGRGFLYYMQAETDRYAALVARASPIVEAHATPPQRVAFYKAVMHLLIRRARYVIDEEIFAYAQMVYEAERSSTDVETQAWAPFGLAVTLLWRGELDDAERLLQESLTNSHRIADPTLRSRTLSYLLVIARRRKDLATAKRLLEPVGEAAQEAGLPEYEAMAAANAAWVAWREGNPTKAVAESQEALHLWESLPNRYPFDWMACLPLIAALLATNRVKEAATWASWLLAPTQQPLPDPITAAVRRSIQAAHNGAWHDARRNLHRAITLAADQSYL